MKTSPRHYIRRAFQYLIIVLLFFGCMYVTDDANAATTPISIAHRGSTADCKYTENTIKAFRHCAGEADAIEIDMRRSKDNVPVFIHDATLDRTTNASGKVSARTFKQLRKVRTNDGSLIPSAYMIANHIKRTNQTVFIDVKVWPTKKGWRILNRRLGPYKHKIIFFSAKKDKYVKKATRFGYGAAHFTWDHEYPPGPYWLMNTGRYTHAWRQGGFTNSRLNKYHDAGFKVVSSSNHPAKWDQFISQQVYGITTDHIHALNSTLR